MNVQPVGWLIFLALIKKFSCGTGIPFQLQGKVKAKEGSCVEIRCHIIIANFDADGAYWFWMKNATWTDNDFKGTIIHSTDTSKHPVSPDFAHRVRYIGFPPSKWKIPSRSSSNPLCSILICDLKKTDSGNYSLRYIGSQKWFTQKEAILTVDENPCLIVFEGPSVVKENETITLTCSTLSSCPSNPQIEGLTQVPAKPYPVAQQNHGKHKNTTVNFTADWKNDGKEFSCQTQDNKDKYMVRNISVTVEYAPKDTGTMMSPISVEEGQSVTLTCSIIGRPNPTYTWFKNKQMQSSQADEKSWTITSIKDSQRGEYHCEAQNKHGKTKSKRVLINVTYAPNVEIKRTPPNSLIREGDEITLTCNVMRSNPQPSSYSWCKDGTVIFLNQTYYVQSIEPENRGNYTCTATNTVGPGISQPFQIEVEYRPRKTRISKSPKDVKVGHSLTFTCDTEANPAPQTYSWYRDSKNKQWTSQTTPDNRLHLRSVQRADEACYMCNATNIINTGDNSRLLCIKVLYRPNNITLSMDTEAIEGQRITINCTVESFPLSDLTLIKNSTSSAQSSKWTKSAVNIFSHKLNVTSAHAGVYTCHAKNSEGEQASTQRKLVVKYAPQNVSVKAQPNLEVDENKLLTLVCSALSHPPVTSVTWMKMIDGKEAIMKTSQSFTLKSVTPSDSGLYSCTASNEIGSGKSLPAEVKVKYGPKHTKITRAAEQQLIDGTSAVTLSCSTQCYPPVKKYVWYMKMDGDRKDKEVSEDQNYTVPSNKPGVYYCSAENELNLKMSDPVKLFLDGGLTKVLIFTSVFILLIIITVVSICRCGRNKSIQQGASNRLPWWTCFGFLACWNGDRRRNLMSEPGLAEPSRSRDDLLPDQPRRPKAQPCQPRPDTTAASNINSVYCTVNLPGKQGPSAQMPNRKEQEQDIYAMVSKPKPPKKDEQETTEPYENISTIHAVKSPNPDSDTSEDEVELNYSLVTFTPKLGHQSADTDSSTSDEEYETQYSEVKI